MSPRSRRNLSRWPAAWPRCEKVFPLCTGQQHPVRWPSRNRRTVLSSTATIS